MASYLGFQFTKRLEPEVFTLSGMVLTDASGVPTNINDGTVTDQDGDSLLIPRGVTSITKPATGTYRITLEQPWYKIRCIDVTLYKSAAANASFQVKQFNPKGATVAGVTAQTIDVIYQVAGVATDLVSAGFFFSIDLKNLNIP